MTYDELKTYLDPIEELLGSQLVDTLLSGLPEGSNEEYGYSEQLVIDLGNACTAHLTRTKAS